MTTTHLLLGSAAVLTIVGIVAAILRAPQPVPEGALSVQEIIARIEQDDALLNRSMYVSGWPHEAPDQPLSVYEAHQAMRSHIDCTREACARKSAAHAVLVAAGRIRPAVRGYVR